MARGLEALQHGFYGGAETGMRKRRIVNEENEFLHKAMLVDREMRREDQMRGANAEAIGEMAQIAPEDRVPDAGTNPTTGLDPQGPPTPQTQAIQDDDDAAMQRVAEIAQRMARSGDMQGALRFVDYAHDKHTQAKDHRERDNLVKEIQIFMEGADTYATAPDGSRVEDPAFAESMTELAASAGDKDVSTDELRAKLTAAKKGQIQSRARQGHKTQMLQHYMQRSADSLAATDPKAPGMSNRMRRLETLRQEYEINHDRYFSDPKWQGAFDEQFTDAENDVVTIPDEKGKPIKVPSESAPQFQAIFQKNAQMADENTKLRNSLLKAQADKAESEARYADRNKPGAQGVGGSRPKVMALGEARKMAHDELHATYESQVRQIKAANDALPKDAAKAQYPSPPSMLAIRDRTRAIMDEANGTGGGVQSSEEDFQSGPAFTRGGAAKSDSLAAPGTQETPADRQRDFIANPEKYLNKFNTDDEIRMWISTGKMPK